MENEYDDALECAQLEFMEAYDNGGDITFNHWAGKYPQYIPQMVEFILDYVAMENRMKRMPPLDPNEPAPQWAIDACNKALISLGIRTSSGG